MRSFTSLALMVQAGVSLAYSVPFRRDFEAEVTRSANLLLKRAAANNYNFSVEDFTGDNKAVYTANVTLDGQQYELQLDTGSSDLWVDAKGHNFTTVNNTNVAISLVYGDTTSASGNIKVGAAQFGNYTIPKQAFLDASGSNATTDNDKGILGLGPPKLSVIYNNLQNSSFNGLPLINQIFNANPSTPPYVTFLLSRSNLGESNGGIFTIGEVNKTFEKVQNASKIPVAQGLNQWVGLMDGIKVNGKTVKGKGGILSQKKVNSSISPAFKSSKNKNKLLAVFDTGTALGFLPQTYFNAIYKNVKGAKTLDKKLGVYSVPCDTKLNVSMTFNGTDFPINPLDLTRLATIDNKTVCINTFAPLDTTSAGFDVDLGDAFLRNVYMLMNYGNWTNATKHEPYVQLLSTTNTTTASKDFDNLNKERQTQWERLNGTFSA